jgi:lipopolysaccharide transport system permease protein
MLTETAGYGVTSPASAESVIKRPIVITPPGRFSLPSLHQLWEAREILLRFGARDVTLRYRQTALGVIWVVLQPLLAAGVFTLVFGHVAKLPTGGVPYFLFSFSGMLAWNLFSSIVARSTPSLVANSALVSKVFFPRILVPLSIVYSVLVDFAVAFGLLVIMLFAYGVNPGFAIVLLPAWVLLVVFLASGLGFVFSAMMVRYRDVQYVVPFLVQFGLYASPIAYSTDAVPERYRAFYDLNPMTWLLEEFRWSTLGQPAPSALYIGLSIIVSIAVFIGGALVFSKMERGFADVI